MSRLLRLRLSLISLSMPFLVTALNAFDTRTLFLDDPDLALFENLYRVQNVRPKISRRAVLSYQRETEICPSTTAWKNLTAAQASDGRMVQIVQDSQIGHQWFYTVGCKMEYENKSCRLIDPGHPTACRTRYNLVPAFIHTPQESDPFGFTMIKIPGQCVCVETATVEVDAPRWLDAAVGSQSAAFQ